MTQVAQFIEPTMAQLDAGFSYGDGNWSLKAVPLGGGVPLIGVAFALTGLGASMEFPLAFTWQININGNCSVAPTILLEGTLDGTNWFTLDTFTATSGALKAILNSPTTPTRIRGVRARQTVAGTGTGNFDVIIAS